MSKSNNKIFKYVNKSPKKKQPLSELILTTLNDVELRTKSMKITIEKILIIEIKLLIIQEKFKIQI